MTFNIYTTVAALLIGAHYEHWRLAREERHIQKEIKIPKGGEKVWGGAKAKKSH